MIANMIKEEFTRSWFTKLLAVLALPVLKRLSRRLDPAALQRCIPARSARAGRQESWLRRRHAVRVGYQARV
ncbi:hypothetical protein ACU4GD_02865 [Cupriavidus basilensis]